MVFFPHAATRTAREPDRNRSLGTGAMGGGAPHAPAGFQRCQIVLAAAQGQEDKLIAEDLDLNFKTVALWRKRFVREGPDSLWEVAEGRGRKPTVTPEEVGADCRRHATNQASRGHALELPHDGQSPRREQSHRESDLAKPSDQTAPDPRLQTFAGSKVSAKADRCRGLVSQSSRRRLWCSVSMKRARFRPWIARNQDYRSKGVAVAR